MPRTERLLGIDATRGIALLGIMAVHIFPQLTSERTPHIAQLITSDRTTAMFPILAGVGLALATGGQNPLSGSKLADFRAALVGRALMIAVIGLFLGHLDSGAAVILTHFGLLFLLAIPFLTLRPRVLFPLAAVWGIASPIISHVLRTRLEDRTYSSPTFDWLHDPALFLQELVFTGSYPLFQWMAYLFAGLALGRLSLNSTRTAAIFLYAGAAIALTSWGASALILDLGGLEQLTQAGIGFRPTSPQLRDGAVTAATIGTDGILTTTFYGTSPTTSWWWLTIASPYSSTTLDLLHTWGVALAVLGLLSLAAKKVPALCRPLALIGGMTLTLYSLHIVLLAELPETLEYTYLLHVGIFFVLAAIWSRFLGRGPLETITTFAATLTREVASKLKPARSTTH